MIDKCPAAHYRKYEEGRFHGVPKVSIYIPAYNASNYIKEAVDSVLNQSFTDLEVVIVNDGSTDSTVDILEKNYSSNPRVKWVTQENKGIGAASNRAIGLCRGHIIGQLDADDRLKPDAIAGLLDYFNMPEVGCVYGCYEVINKEIKPYEDKAVATSLITSLPPKGSVANISKNENLNIVKNFHYI